MPSGLPAGTTLGQNLLKFHLRPAARIGLDASEVEDILDLEAIRSERVTSDQEMQGLIAEAQRADLGEIPASLQVRNRSDSSWLTSP